jgi:CHAT domain-containing protein
MGDHTGKDPANGWASGESSTAGTRRRGEVMTAASRFPYPPRKALPGTKSEAEGIATRAFGGKRVQLLLGEQASESAVKRLSESGELARQRIVHFACHAFFDNDYPQYSALVLSEAAGEKDGRSNETGYLTVEDVALLRFNADLVALSASTATDSSVSRVPCSSRG